MTVYINYHIIALDYNNSSKKRDFFMSRQQFIAELTQYLTFVTASEREKIVSVFNEKFDSVGPENETTLLMELGTPMSIAISLKRRKEAGEPIVPGTEPEPDEDSAAETVSDGDDTAEEAAEAVDVEENESDLPVAETPDIEAAETADYSLETEAAEAEETPPTEEPEPEPEIPEIPGISAAGTAPQLPIEPAPPRKKLTVGGAIGASVLSLVVTPLLLVPTTFGAYLLLIMGTFVIGALRTLSTLTDALWILALGLVAGALGILILWFFIWAIISCIHRFFLGKPLPESLHKHRMKKLWKTCWILFVVLLVLGIATGIVGYTLGGQLNDLYTNSVTNAVLDWVTNNSIIDFVGKIFA